MNASDMTHTTSEVGLSTPIVSVKPIVLSAPERGEDLQIRLSAPTTGADLPVVVLAHGFGLAMDSYDPLVDFWASNGFVLIQPTFLDSLTLGLAPTDPRYPSIWRTRVDDLTHVVDELDTILAAVPGLAGRVDRNRLAVAGHSWGGQSASMLLGARVVGSDGLPGADGTDRRIRAGVLLSTTGTGGEDLTPFAQEHFSFMSPNFDQLGTPTLVVAGDSDQSPLSTRGPDWFTDAHSLSPGSEHLLTVFGGEHSLGGIHAYHSTDTTDESPDRVDIVRRTTWAWLRMALDVDNGDWSNLRDSLASAPEPAGRIEST